MHVQHAKSPAGVNNNNDVRRIGSVVGKQSYSRVLEKQLVMPYTEEDRKSGTKGPPTAQIMRSHTKNMGRNHPVPTGPFLGEQ